jgi:hypothetical protein
LESGFYNVVNTALAGEDLFNLGAIVAHTGVASVTEVQVFKLKRLLADVAGIV